MVITHQLFAITTPGKGSDILQVNYNIVSPDFNLKKDADEIASQFDKYLIPDQSSNREIDLYLKEKTRQLYVVLQEDHAISSLIPSFQRKSDHRIECTIVINPIIYKVKILTPQNNPLSKVDRLNLEGLYSGIEGRLYDEKGFIADFGSATKKFRNYLRDYGLNYTFTRKKNVSIDFIDGTITLSLETKK